MIDGERQCDNAIDRQVVINTRKHPKLGNACVFVYPQYILHTHPYIKKAQTFQRTIYSKQRNTTFTLYIYIQYIYIDFCICNISFADIEQTPHTIAWGFWQPRKSTFLYIVFCFFFSCLSSCNVLHTMLFMNIIVIQIHRETDEKKNIYSNQLRLHLLYPSHSTPTHIHTHTNTHTQDQHRSYCPFINQSIFLKQIMCFVFIF